MERQASQCGQEDLFWKEKLDAKKSSSMLAGRMSRVIGPIKVHVDNKGIIDGLQKGKGECIKPRAGDADLWIKTWEELHELVKEASWWRWNMSRHIGAKRKRKICRTMEAELEVQRTFKRSELTAFLCFLKKVIGPIKVYVDNKGIIDRLWRGGRKGISPKAGDADLWNKIWEELHRLAAGDFLVEVEHTAQKKEGKRCRTLCQVRH